ncbi:MAG: mandelate racemase/muconate lactonizing enzyme family protein [Dehalococcoidia bacterium]
MKITEIELFPIAIPYRTPWRNRHTEERGAAMTHLETTILKVRTDEGIDGLGEAKGPGVAAAVRDGVGPFLRGRDPFEIGRLNRELEDTFGRSSLVAGIDFALHDIVGRALGVPVYQLLGGMARERVPLVWTLPFISIEEQTALAVDRVAEGFTHAIKMKVGVPGDLEHVLAVAGVVGDVPIRPDSNMGHSMGEALEQYAVMQAEGVRFELIEDPCPTDWDAYQQISEATGAGVSVHHGWSTFEDLSDLISAAKPGIRCVNIMPTYWGIYRTAQIVGALEVAGIGWTMGTSHDSSIKIAASLHLGTALGNRLYPADLLGPRLHTADVAAEPLDLNGGYGRAPDGPGLGVRLDERVLAEYRAEEAGGARE